MLALEHRRLIDGPAAVVVAAGIERHDVPSRIGDAREVELELRRFWSLTDCVLLVRARRGRDRRSRVPGGSGIPGDAKGDPSDAEEE